MGSGKTTALEYFKDHNLEVFKMDEYIHNIYQRDLIGYNLIKKYFGDEFVTETQVDRNKLRELITNSQNDKEKLDSIMLNVMVNKINQLYSLNKIIIVELGIYIYNQYNFYYFFNKIIAIVSKRTNIKDDFNKFHTGFKFSTKAVENPKNLINSNIVYCDYIVDNDVNLNCFYDELKKFLPIFL